MTAETPYELAERLHAASMEAIEGKSFAECRELGIQEATCNPNGTRKLHASGRIDGRRAYQTFSYSEANRNYYLWTVGTENDGRDTHVGHRFVPDGEATPEAIAALGTSFYAQRVG